MENGTQCCMYCMLECLCTTHGGCLYGSVRVLEGVGRGWGLSLPFDVVNTDKLSGVNFTPVTALVQQERENTAVVECPAPLVTSQHCRIS